MLSSAPYVIISTTRCRQHHMLSSAPHVVMNYRFLDLLHYFLYARRPPTGAASLESRRNMSPWPANVQACKSSSFQVDMIWHDTIWYEMRWNDMKWNDMKWYEMIWYEMKWYDMIWHEMFGSQFGSVLEQFSVWNVAIPTLNLCFYRVRPLQSNRHRRIGAMYALSFYRVKRYVLNYIGTCLTSKV